MIVDLVRNDLGAVAVTGSVEVPALNAVEQHPGLVHLVSTVRGPAASGRRLGRPAGGDLPAGLGHRRAEVQRAADHRRPRAGAARPLLRGGRLGRRRPRRATLAVGIRTFWDRPADRLHLGTGAGITWGSDAARGVGRDRAEGAPAARGGRGPEDARMKVWVDGAVVEADEARVSVFDHGLTVGDGVFETAKVVDGVPFALTRHLDRLASSARGLGLTPPDDGALRDAVAAALAANADAVAAGPLRLRITLTGGTSPLGSDRGDAGPTLVVALAPLTAWAPTAEGRRRAVDPQRASRHRRAQDHVVRRQRRRAGPRQGARRQRGGVRQHRRRCSARAPGPTSSSCWTASW